MMLNMPIDSVLYAKLGINTEFTRSRKGSSITCINSMPSFRASKATIVSKNYFSHILTGTAPTCTIVETICPLCGEYLDVLTHVHAAKHGIPKQELRDLITEQEARKELT